MKKKLSKVFKSRAFKILSIPLIVVSSVALGVGVGYLTTQQSMSVKAEGAPIVTNQNDLYSHLGSNGGDTGPVVTPGSVPTDQTTPKPTTTKPKATVTEQVSTTPSCNVTQKTSLDSIYVQNVKDLVDITSSNYVTDSSQLPSAEDSLYVNYATQVTAIHCIPIAEVHN